MIEITERMISLAQKDTKDLLGLTLKLMEEVGELAEAVNYKLGNLPHKQMKEKIEGEVADVINCAISVLVRAYPKKDSSYIYFLLEEQLKKKADKWESIISNS